MHVALPKNNPVKTDRSTCKDKTGKSELKADDIKVKISNAQTDLDKLNISSAKQLKIPSIQREIKSIVAKHDLAQTVEVHMHGKKAEFCEGHHEDELHVLHQANGQGEKKTSKVQAKQAEPKQNQFMGFLRNFFSTAA